MTNAEIAKVWGDRLRRTRKRKGMEANEVAAAAGLHPSQLSRYERGREIPGPEIQVRLAKALRQKHRTLFSIPDRPPKNDRIMP